MELTISRSAQLSVQLLFPTHPYYTLLPERRTEKETLLSDTISMMNPTSNPFTNPFINTTTNDENNGQKFATIGRSNPFTYSNKSKNPFLDRLDAQHHGNGELTSGSPMSTSPGTSPEASLDPVSDNGSSTSTLNKIVSKLYCTVYIISVVVVVQCRLLNLF